VKAYKVLNPDLTSPFRNFQFELNKKYTCKDFDEDFKNECSIGFYATGIDGIIYSFNIHKKVFECEVTGKKVEINQFKKRYENIEIIQEIPHKEIKKLAKAQEENVGYKLSEALFPINPLLIKKHIPLKQAKSLLEEWASVNDSIRSSVWDSVNDSVRSSVWNSVRSSVWDLVWDLVRDLVGDSVRSSIWNSVGASIENSIWNSVGDSIWNSARAYISSLFPNMPNWKYIDHKVGVNPYECCIKLWKGGIVPSFDGKIWRLHAGKNAKIIYEVKK